jgi:hypothetical protein
MPDFVRRFLRGHVCAGGLRRPLARVIDVAIADGSLVTAPRRAYRRSSVGRELQTLEPAGHGVQIWIRSTFFALHLDGRRASRGSSGIRAKNCSKTSRRLATAAFSGRRRWTV